MGEDEAGTLERLKSLRKELVQPNITERKGRIVKLMGDGLLAEFPSVVEAVQCALDIQDSMLGREADLPDERRIRLRIGVNLGDIIVEGSDIYGDGVNVAARLEGLAEPGGICISGKVYEEVGKKLPTAFEDLGEQEVKNIAEPVRVYRWTDAAADPMPGMAGAEGAPPLSDKPSIAVLPFTNMSGDPEQEYFSDGITEDIITALSRISGLLVVARNSTMVYKGKAVDLKKVGREQGVRHVLEGSVRKGGNRIRVTAQLIDATTGNHQWAERYDRKLDDIFEVQDEITKKVTTELNVQLARGEEARVWATGTSNIEAWANVIRAIPLAGEHVKEHNVEAQRLADEAVHLDPTYAAAWVSLGWTHWEDALWSWGESDEASMKTALSCAQRALKCDSENPEALALRGTIYLTNKNAKKAIELCKKAVALSPNHAGNVAFAAMAMIFGGEPKNGLPLMKRAIRLSPIYPQWYLMMVGVVHHIVGDQDKAIGIFRECVAKEPETTLHKIWLASALIEVEQDEEAKRLGAEILEIDPDFTASSWVDGFSADNYLTNLLLTNLVKAGLPN